MKTQETMKHTPGPWTVKPVFTVNNGETYRIVAGKKVICETSAKGMKEDFVNITLMAAAPDLLETCKALMIHLFGEVDTEAQHFLAIKAKEAIAKAEGRS